MSVEASEYRARQRGLAAALAGKGLSGALVVSRGGGTFDRSANVLYLTGHYQPYAYLPETPGLFSGRSHTALALGSDGQAILCVSVPDIDRACVTADDVRYGASFTETVADAVESVAGGNGPLGLIGADVVPFDLWQRLTARLDRQWTQVDELVAAMRRRKSPAEQDLVRAATGTGRRAVTAFLATLVPGARESDAVGAAVASAVAEGAGLYFAAAASGPDTARYASTAMPGWSTRPLKPGDLVRFDLGIVQQGYLCDFGRTAVVGDASSEQRRLLTTLHDALDEVIAAVRPGVEVSAVVDAGDRALAEAGVVSGDGEVAAGTIRATYPAHWGHGLGLGWERPWLVAGEQLEVEPGMVLAVERAITLAGVGTAAAEQNLLVTAAGADVLTEGPEGRWS